MPPNPYTGEPMQPRKWQREALPLVGAALREGRMPLVIACTGAGKSVFLGALVRAMAAGGAVVVTTPTQALVRQLASTLATFVGRARVGVYFGAKKQPERDVVVCCNPSLPNLTAELAAMGRAVRLWVADEAHKTQTAAILDSVPALAPKYRVGVTATPYRSADHEALELWTDVAYRYTLMDALRDGVLVPWSQVCYDGMVEADVDDLCIGFIREYATGPGVVSAISIEDATRYAERLTSEGIPAEPVHSRMSRTALAETLGRLESGELRCVVHVALLIEGVDLPWLRWGCLRRPMAASVSFVQQLGRFLRVHPGKSEAVIIDPHDLLGTVGLSHPDQLGEAEERLADDLDRKRDGEGEGKVVRELPPAKAVDAATMWLRRCLLAMQVAGAVPSDIARPSQWRHLLITERQMQSLPKMVKAWRRYLPGAVADGLGYMCRPHVLPTLQRGAASDALSLLFAVARMAPEGGWEARKGWGGPVWPEMDLPELDAGAVLGLRRDPETGRLGRK